MTGEDEFQVNDKVLCVDDTPDRGPFGYFPNQLRKGATYTVFAVDQLNVRGEVLQVTPDQEGKPEPVYEKRHFKLLNRCN